MYKMVLVCSKVLEYKPGVKMFIHVCVSVYGHVPVCLSAQLKDKYCRILCEWTLVLVDLQVTFTEGDFLSCYTECRFV